MRFLKTFAGMLIIVIGTKIIGMGMGHLPIVWFGFAIIAMGVIVMGW